MIVVVTKNMSSIKYYYINHQQQFFLSWPCHHWEWPILTIFQLFRIKKENIKVIKKKEDCGIPNLIFFRVNKLSLNIFFLVFDQKNFHFPSFLLHLWNLKYLSFCNVTNFSLFFEGRKLSKNMNYLFSYSMSWMWLRGELWGLLLKAITLRSIWLMYADIRECKIIKKELKASFF